MIENSSEAVRLKAAENSIRNQKIQEMELEIRELRAKLETKNREEERDKGEITEKKEKEKKPTCAAYIRGDCRFGWKGKQS